MVEKAIDLTEKSEVPKSFSEAFNEIKAAAQEQEASVAEEAPKRGRPRKIKDELDRSTKDDIDEIAIQDATDEADKETDIVDEEAKPEEKVEDKKSAEAEDTYIPDEWVEAGRKAGMSDTTIQTLAVESPDILKRLTGKAEPPAQPRRQEQPRQVSDDLFKPIELKLDPDEHGKDLADTVDMLVKRINDQTVAMKQLHDQNQVTQRETFARQISAQEDRFDTLLDKAASDLPAVGKSDKLKTGTIEWTTRKTIWDKAEAIRRGEPGLKFEDSIDDALAWYRGKHGTSVIEKRLVTKLKAQAGKLTYRPTHKIASEPEYKSEDERGVASVKKVLDRYRNA